MHRHRSTQLSELLLQIHNPIAHYEPVMKRLVCVLLNERVFGDKLSCKVANLPGVGGWGGFGGKLSRIGGDWTGCNRTELWSWRGNDGMIGSEANSTVIAKWCGSGWG